MTSPEHADRIVLHIAGADRPGVTARLMKIIAEDNAELVDIGQSVLHGYLMLSAIVNIPQNSRALRRILFEANELGLRFEVTPFRAHEGGYVVGAVPALCVTVLGPLADGSAAARITGFMAEQAMNIREIRSLSEPDLSGLELISDLAPGRTLSDIELATLRGDFLRMGMELGVDLAVQKDDMFRRTKRLVCMDVDSTFVRGEFIDELADLAGCKAQVSEITARAMRGELDFKQALAERVKLLEGLPLERAMTLLDKIELTPGADRFVQALRSLGFRIGLVSGGFSVFVDELKKRYALDFAFANELEIQAGKLTGRVRGTVVDGERKAQILKDMAQVYNCRLEQTVAIGDGANDVFMLQTAGLGIAFRAKPKLQAVADMSLNHNERLDTLIYLMGFNARDLRDSVSFATPARKKALRLLAAAMQLVCTSVGAPRANADGSSSRGAFLEPERASARKALRSWLKVRKAKPSVRWAAFTLTVLLTAGSARAEPVDAPSAPSSGAPSTAPEIAFGPPTAPPPSPPAPSAAAPDSPSPGAASAPAEVAPPAVMPSAAGSAKGARPASSHAELPSIGPPPPPAPSASSSASHGVPPKADAAVRLGETTAFTLRVAGGGRSAVERARLATKVLAAAVDDPRANEVKAVLQGDVAVVYAGPAPIIQLFEDDARAAGDSSLEVHASAVAASLRQAIASERQRSRVAKNVFSLSLVVFFALIAFYLMRKLGEVAERMQSWLEEKGDRVLAIRVQRIELVTPAVLKSSALIALSLAKWLGQFGILYSWLVVVLSLFEATRGYTERLTGFVVSPLSQLMGRLATALPLLVVAVIAALSVFVLVRFVGLFFGGVARRETALAWLPPDLAGPTSVLLRLAIVLSALVFAAPVVTGDSDGAFGRAGTIALVAIGLAGIPLLATGLVGSVVLFGRRLRVGDHVEFAGHSGRISAINLLELRLATPGHAELRIPHLLLLTSPLRGLGARPRLGVEIAVSAKATPATVLQLFDEAAARVARDVHCEVLSADADGILYRVSAACDSLESRSTLTASLVDALSAAAIPLGRASGRARPE